MQPYVESLPNYIDGAPPWTLTTRGHGITSDHWSMIQKSHLEISRNHVLTTYQSCTNNQVIFIMRINL